VELASGDSLEADEFLDRRLVDMLIDAASFNSALAETEV
jgi:hypothetical protein